MSSNKVIRFSKKRWVRVLALMAGAVFLYAFVLWCLPNLVDKVRLRQNIIDWSIQKFAYRSPASCGDVDLAVRINGRTDLYVHDFELDPPNSRFPLPWFYVDTFRVSAPLYTLFGGVDSDPVVQVRDCILRLHWNEHGVFNLDGLRLSEKKWDLPFLQHLDVSNLNFSLMKCRLQINKPDLSALFKINGLLTFSGAAASLQFFAPGVLEVSAEGSRKRYQTEIKIDKAGYDFNTKVLSNTFGEISSFPLAVIPAFISGFPVVDAGQLSGKIQCVDNQAEFDGVLSNANFLQYNGDSKLKASCLFDSAGVKKFKAELRSADNHYAMALAAESNKGGQWGNLGVYFNQLDFSHLTDNTARPCLSFLARNFAGARIEADIAKYFGFAVNKISMDIVTNKSLLADVSLSGLIAGGQFTVVAKKLPVDRAQMPETILGVLTIKDAGGTLPRFNRYLPAVFQCTPLRGSGELAISFDNGLSEQRGNLFFSLRLKLENVTVSGISGGQLVQALANFPGTVIELENLCRRASVESRDPFLKIPSPFSELKFSSIKLSYEIAPDGRGKLRGLVAECENLGIIEAVGEQQSDGGFIMRLFLRKVPAKYIENNPALSAGVKRSLRELDNKKGLEFSCRDQEKASGVKALFLQDAFRIWSENRADNNK